MTTGHEMKGFDHYIVKHQLFDENFQFFDEVMFNPADDLPVSEHSIAGKRNVVYALSVCNIHDSWLNVIEL